MRCVASGREKYFMPRSSTQRANVVHFVRDEGHGFVSGRCQFLDELVESEDTSFLEAVHATADFEVDVAIASDGNVVMVIIPDLLRNDGGSDAYVMGVLR